MIGVGGSVLTSGASLALDARVAVGAGVFAVGQAEPAPVETQPVPVEQKRALYNAFEFIYRQDFGKIILLEQNAETGEEITQVPNEYHLRQYAATARAQRMHDQEKLLRGSQPATTAKTSGAVAATAAVVAKTAPEPSGQPAPAAAQPTAPTVTVTAAAHLDIKV